MKVSGCSIAIPALALAGSALGATYSLTDTVVGSDFNSFFAYEAIADPTNGRVDYVDQATAEANGITSFTDDSFILKADDTTVLAASDPGRMSARLQSNNQYSTHVAVFNMRHMPAGCGTWPAVWEYGADWPNQGEVDIVEGVNVNTADQTTLHTAAGCTIPASGVAQSGTTTTTDCVAADNGNAGCGVTATLANSYGAPFNAAGGGIYAIERTDDFIKVWFWSADGGDAPSDASSGAGSVDTDNWGEPDAFFPNTDCDIASLFGPNWITINLTFCGDWAGNADVWAASGCPSDCVDYVNENPSAFSEAYFDFASIHVYQ